MIQYYMKYINKYINNIVSWLFPIKEKIFKFNFQKIQNWTFLLRPHMPLRKKQSIKQKRHWNRFNKDFEKKDAKNLQHMGMLLLLLLLLSRFSRVWLCATPQTAARQALPSLGFSRQEYWSGLPFPSPVHESEKWKWSRSVVSDLATPWTVAYQTPLSMGFSRQEYWSGVPLPSLTYGYTMYLILFLFETSFLFLGVCSWTMPMNNFANKSFYAFLFMFLIYILRTKLLSLRIWKNLNLWILLCRKVRPINISHFQNCYSHK